jgi:hypothetical protein
MSDHRSAYGPLRRRAGPLPGHDQSLAGPGTRSAETARPVGHPAHTSRSPPLQHPSSRRACPKDLRRRHPRQPRPTPSLRRLGRRSTNTSGRSTRPTGHPRAVRASCCRRAFPPRKTNRCFMHYVDSALDPAAEDRLAAWLDREPQTASVLTLRTGFYSVAALEVMQERVDHFDVDKLKEINDAIEPRCSGQRLRR